MNDIDSYSVEVLRTWLSNRVLSDSNFIHYEDDVVIEPGDDLEDFNLPNLHLYNSKNIPRKGKNEVEINQLFKWMMEFYNLIRRNRCDLKTLELLRNGFDQKQAQFNVQEAVSVVQGTLAPEASLDLPIFIEDPIIIEDRDTPIGSVLNQICIHLFTRNPVMIVLKTFHYPSCLMVAFLVDLIYEAGVLPSHISLVIEEENPKISILESDISSFISPSLADHPKQSSVAVCFFNSDTSQAIKLILESYTRDTQWPNMLIIVEESIYDKFLTDWKLNFNEIIPLENTSIQVDSSCIDIKEANRMAGRCINITKFRSIQELFVLLNKLSKIPRIQLWTNDYMMAREICLSPGRLNHCQEFWLNHLPEYTAGRRFFETMCKEYRKSLKKHMNEVYSDIFHYHEVDIERLRKLQAIFAKKPKIFRGQHIIKAYISLISKRKSLKRFNTSINESVVSMRRFQLYADSHVSEAPGESRIETSLSPIGLAVFMVRDENMAKSRALVIEFIFKSLILGNGVFMICPPNLRNKIPMETILKYELPLVVIDIKPGQQVCLSTPRSSEVGDPTLPECKTIDSWSFRTPSNSEASDRSFESTESDLNSSLMVRRLVKCPKNTFAIELKQGDLTSERIETMALALGVKKKSIWYPDGVLGIQTGGLLRH